MRNTSKETIQYDMVIEEKKKRRSGKSERPEGKYVAFATNSPCTDVEEYSGRWGIEMRFRWWRT